LTLKLKRIISDPTGPAQPPVHSPFRKCNRVTRGHIAVGVVEPSLTRM
jgi:hypothetical protein